MGALTPAESALAAEVHRRRILAQGSEYPRDLKASLAEVAFLAHYGRVPTVDDLRRTPRRLHLVPRDESGRAVRVVAGDFNPLRVWANQLDVDIYVFVRVDRLNNVDLLGWLPLEQVEQAPVWWFEENGERKSYAHEIERGMPAPLPQHFDFADLCPHLEKYGQIWHNALAAWECCHCGRYLYDEASRISIQKEGGESHQIPSVHDLNVEQLPTASEVPVHRPFAASPVGQGQLRDDHPSLS